MSISSPMIIAFHPLFPKFLPLLLPLYRSSVKGHTTTRRSAHTKLCNQKIMIALSSSNPHTVGDIDKKRISLQLFKVHQPYPKPSEKTLENPRSYHVSVGALSGWRKVREAVVESSSDEEFQPSAVAQIVGGFLRHTSQVRNGDRQPKAPGRRSLVEFSDVPSPLAYLHVMLGLGFDFHQKGEPMTMAESRKVYLGMLIANVGYDAKSGEEEIAAGNMDMVAFGRPDQPQNQ